MAMTASPTQKFKATVLALYAKFPFWHEDLLAAGVTGLPERGIITTGQMFLECYDDANLLKMYVDKTLPYWSKIKSRDETFLNQDLGSLTSVIPSALVQAVFSAKTPKGDTVISPRAHTFIWDCLAQMTRFSIDHIVAEPSRFPSISNLAEIRQEWNR